MTKATIAIPQAITFNELLRPRVDFRTRDFDRLAEQKGLRVRIDKTIRCSCVREVQGAPLARCVNCNGEGVIFYDTREARAIVQSLNYKRMLKEYGEILVGTYMITTQYRDRVSWMDRVTVLDGEAVYFQNIFPELRNKDESQEASELLVYEPIVVDKAFMFVDEYTAHRILVEDTDFTMVKRKLVLSDDLKQEMIDNDEAKKYISVRYRYLPTYYVMDVVKHIRNTKVLQPGHTEKVEPLPIHALMKESHHVKSDQGFDEV